MAKKPDRPKTPNIDHLIRARYKEMGFSDEMIAELEAFTKAEAEKLKAARAELEAKEDKERARERAAEEGIGY